MPTRTESPTSAVAASAPVVVFFGFPTAGKSTLLATFSRTAAPGESTVELRPADSSLTVVRELVRHEITVAGGRFDTPESVVLYDCDGKSASELLAAPDRMVKGSARGALAAAVRSADALVVVLDAGASPEHVDHVFRTFRVFLDTLEAGRTFGREVGGLPVFLTLTKCDTLHRPDDEPTDWLARIENRKRELTARFHDFFEGELHEDDPESIDPSPYLTFGSLDLQVIATAVRVPEGKMFAAFADADGSFGVERLVRDCLTAARAFHGRSHSARRRLKFTVFGLLGLVAALFVGAVTLSTTASYGPTEALAARVREFREREGSTAVRHSDEAYPERIKTLTAIHESPLFDNIPDDLQDFVNRRLAEYQSYAEYRSKFQPPRLSPEDLRTREEIDQLAADLNRTLAPPKEYEKGWTETTASKLRAKWQADLDAIRTAEEVLYDWYRGLDRRATELLFTTKPPDFEWYRNVGTLFERAENPPFDPSAAVPGSVGIPGVPRADPLRFAAAYEFDRVLVARRDWEDSRDRLRHLRQLTAVLGITSGPGSPPAVLDLPEPTSVADSLGLASARLKALADAFPGANLAHPEWVAVNFPDPVRSWLEPRLRAVFDTGVRHVQSVIRDRLGATADRDAWRKLADGLLQEPPLRDWGRLLGRLRRWAVLRETDGDPVEELAAFLRRESFSLELRALEVAIPDDLLDRPAQPTGDLVLTVKPAGDGTPIEAAFQSKGSPRSERPDTIHRFEAKSEPVQFVYNPGDEFSARLPIRSGGQEYRLVWSSPRTMLYQFDALARPPMLERTGNIPVPPERAAGVRVEFVPPDGFPEVPVLLNESGRR